MLLKGLTLTGFIQARPSQIQGLFKDFSRTNFKFSRTIILTQIRKIWHCHSLLPHPVKTFGLKKKLIISVKMNSLKTKSIKLWLQFLFEPVRNLRMSETSLFLVSYAPLPAPVTIMNSHPFVSMSLLQG